MAIAVNGGHVARAIDFYKSEGKYFVIGGTSPWVNEQGEIDESTPKTPSVEDFRLDGIIGFKKIDNISFVLPVTEEQITEYGYNDLIEYRTQKWRKIDLEKKTTVSSAGISAGSSTFYVENNLFKKGDKIRIAGKHIGTVKETSGLMITLSGILNESIPAGSQVLGGAVVEGAKYVYVDCYLNYDQFPLEQYRQIGLCTGVTPNTEDTLISAGISGVTANEYTSTGLLEVLDNRIVSERNISQRELISLIIEF